VSRASTHPIVLRARIHPRHSPLFSPHRITHHSFLLIDRRGVPGGVVGDGVASESVETSARWCFVSKE